MMTSGALYGEPTPTVKIPTPAPMASVLMDEYVAHDPFRPTEFIEGEPRVKWNNRYLELATMVASWSKDPSSKIGAVAVGTYGQILSTGYNGFPRGIADRSERLTHRETKYKYVVHAEMNVIYNASLTGVSLNGSTVYVSGLPVCSDCAKGLIQSGVTRIVVRDEDLDASEKWRDSWSLSYHMFLEAGVEVEIMEKIG